MTDEAVDHPSHYGGEDNTYEVIKVIEALDLGFHLGNVLKYIGRPGKGKYLEDLKKARWYLDRKIALEEVKAVIPPVPEHPVLLRFPEIAFKLPNRWLTPYPKYFDARIVADVDWTIEDLCRITASQFNLNEHGGYGISLAPDSGFLKETEPVSWMLKMWPPEKHNYYLRARDV